MKRLKFAGFLIFAIGMYAFTVQDNRDNDAETAWIKEIVSKLNVADYYLTLDHSGNLLITGYFISSAQFGDKELVAMGNYDIFVAKYSPQSELLWLDQIGSDKVDIARIIKVDSNNNIYVTGYISGISLFGDYIVSPKGSYDIFTTKYSPEGKIIWVKCEGAEIKTGNDHPKSKKVNTSYKYTK
jgi:hypothetical protein